MSAEPRPTLLPRQAADVATAAQLACLLEVSAPKPGNVAPGAHFHDTRYEQFLASAAAIGPAVATAGERPLGATIRAAVEATARWGRANTNLGIVLLLAPLARAALTAAAGSAASSFGLRASVERVLDETTVGDAADVYAAIRLAAPGGLGRADAQDVAGEPTAPLRDVMALAAGRDAIAREYATTFAHTFDVGAPALARARAVGLHWDDAVLETFLALLAAAPDTHIARKLGADAAADVMRRARVVTDLGGARTPAGREAIVRLDGELRDPGNAWNPGATADLTAAAIFVVLLDGGWR
ncbi:MAG TPA: triphosphoribosyl-dephospho-CoA synthase [Gemmatimonadaceae bacterium]|nr:triphosphoribosyl-dephospho-CoA synthase [Gemmatimonadaceae bacterium]